ncbi:MAG: histidinol-phosphatase [Bacillota bacterium]
MFLDYHVHLENGPYERGWALRFLEAAERVGIQEVGLVEHGHRFVEARHLLDIPWAAQYCTERTDDFVNLVLSLKAGGYPVKLGIEMDYLRGKEEATQHYLEGHPWDYVIGSVHWDLAGDGTAFPFDHLDVTWPENEVNSIYRRYFGLVKEAVSSGLFDILGHLDVVKAAGQRPGLPYDGLLRETLAEIGNAGMCMEFSSAGLRKPAKETYPPRWYLRTARELGIPVVTASDAHYPRETGFKAGDLVIALYEAGYTTLTCWNGRQSYQVPLPDPPP